MREKEYLQVMWHSQNAQHSIWLYGSNLFHVQLYLGDAF
jgi:hypothetical protein